MSDVERLRPATPTDAYLFGDLLALARANWARQMASAVANLGYVDYRRTDAALLRMLRRAGPTAISAIGSRLGVTRQAARKLVDGLHQRGYATESRSATDGRSVTVTLTDVGAAYADTLVDVVLKLNRAFTSRVSERDLVAADTALRAVFTNEARASAARLVPPPHGRPGRSPTSASDGS